MQAITASISVSHTLTLDLSYPGSTSATHTLRIDALDELGNVIDTDTHVLNGTPLSVSFEFVPTSDDTTIRLTNTDATDAPGSDALLDKISVTETDTAEGDNSFDGGDGADTIADLYTGNSGALGDGIQSNNDFIDCRGNMGRCGVRIILGAPYIWQRQCPVSASPRASAR